MRNGSIIKFTLENRVLATKQNNKKLKGYILFYKNSHRKKRDENKKIDKIFLAFRSCVYPCMYVGFILCFEISVSREKSFCENHVKNLCYI